MSLNEKNRLLLEHFLKQLKLPTFLREYGATADDCSKGNKDFREYLFRLAERELLERECKTKQRLIKAAGFPVIKTLETFDFLAIPSLNKMLVHELTRSEYVNNRENVIILGNSGTGKTHIATALGVSACQNRSSTLFRTAAGLSRELIEARDEKQLGRLLNKLSRIKLLIIDEMGYVPLSKSSSELLFEVISKRYEQGSVIVTSNLPFDEWTEVFDSERLTGALLDRLTHHVHILEMNGDSYRLRQSKKKKRKRKNDPSEG
jgi:DNA replication protein DnaC